MFQIGARPVDLHEAAAREGGEASQAERMLVAEDAIAELSEIVSEDGEDYGDAIAELSQLVSDLYETLGGE